MDPNIGIPVAEIMGIQRRNTSSRDLTQHISDGFSNSADIVYYQHYQTAVMIDSFELVKNDMRNFRKLTDLQLNYIEQLSPAQIKEMFIIYNQCIELVNEIMK